MTTCSPDSRRRASYDGKFYAAPYYSGARIVFYNTAQYATAGVEVPATLDDYVDNAGTLAAALPGVSGVWYPGQDWYNALPFIWENGGEVAVQGDDGTWDAQFSSPESLEGSCAGAGADGELDGAEGRRRDRAVGSVP